MERGLAVVGDSLNTFVRFLPSAGGGSIVDRLAGGIHGNANAARPQLASLEEKGGCPLPGPIDLLHHNPVDPSAVFVGYQHLSGERSEVFSFDEIGFTAGTHAFSSKLHRGLVVQVIEHFSGEENGRSKRLQIRIPA